MRVAKFINLKGTSHWKLLGARESVSSIDVVTGKSLQGKAQHPKI